MAKNSILKMGLPLIVLLALWIFLCASASASSLDAVWPETPGYDVRTDGSLVIDAVGRIVKGAHRSESHQTSRALCFEDGQTSKILPELLIDEDDVQASHAMSIGRMDEDQLYYMMSRGLSVEECASLVSTGYLMPVCDVIDHEELRTALRQELERKLSV